MNARACAAPHIKRRIACAVSKMRLPTYAIVAAAALGALVVGMMPVLRYWYTGAQEYGQRETFAREDAARLVEKYPMIIGTFVEHNARAVAEGAFLPAVDRAWETNVVVVTVRAISHWIATNFFVRALSPQSWQDCVALAALVLFTLGMGGAVAFVVFVCAHMRTNMAFARTMSKNRKSALSSHAAQIVDE